MASTFDFKSDAEADILKHFQDRAEARGKSRASVRKMKRAVIDVLQNGTMLYVYSAGGERVYMTDDASSYRDRISVFFGNRPSFFPAIRGRLDWKVVNVSAD